MVGGDKGEAVMRGRAGRAPGSIFSLERKVPEHRYPIWSSVTGFIVKPRRPTKKKSGGEIVIEKKCKREK